MESQAVIIDQLRAGYFEIEITAEQNDMGPGLSSEVLFDEDDHIERQRKIFAQKLRLVNPLYLQDVNHVTGTYTSHKLDVSAILAPPGATPKLENVTRKLDEFGFYDIQGKYDNAGSTVCHAIIPRLLSQDIRVTQGVGSGRDVWQIIISSNSPSPYTPTLKTGLYNVFFGKVIIDFLFVNLS